MAIEAVIFDIDGLMIDSERVSQRSWGLTMAEAGYELTDSVYIQMIGRTEKDVKKILAVEYGGQFPFEQMYTNREARFYEIIAQDGIPVKPGLLELLAWVKAQPLKIAVASSTYCRLAESKLVAAGIREHFEVLVTGDEVVNGKPAPDLFLAAARKINTDPARCVVLEDSRAGIQAAYAAGMYPILVPDMQPIDDEVVKLAYKVVGTLDQAIPCIQQLL